MPDVFVAKISQFPDGERRIVSHDGREIGVFHWQGKFYAYENLCVHQGGPACEGIMRARATASSGVKLLSGTTSSRYSVITVESMMIAPS